MSTQRKIAESLFKNRPDVIQRGAERLPLRVGDHVADAAYADLPVEVPDGFGSIAKITGSDAIVDWRDGTRSRVALRALVRIAQKYAPDAHDSAYDIPKFSKGDRVVMGNGDRGRVLREVVGPTGFKSFHVHIEESVYPPYVGRRVFSTVNGMAKISSLDPDIVASIYNIDGDTIAVVGCEVAADEHAQVEGLQKYSSLPQDSGMLFPYDPPRQVTFHMGAVQFPIDILFINGSGVITEIQHNRVPGIDESWGSKSRVAGVLEVNGGFCRARGIHVGHSVRVRNSKTAQETFQPNRPDVHTRAPTDVRPQAPDRFKGHDTPDKVLEEQPLDGEHYDQQNGYDPVTFHDVQDAPTMRSGRKVRK